MSSVPIGEVPNTDPLVLVPLENPNLHELPTGPYTDRAVDLVRVLTGTPAPEGTSQEAVVAFVEPLIDHLATLDLPASIDPELPAKLRLCARGLGDIDILNYLGIEPIYANVKRMNADYTKVAKILKATGWNRDVVLLDTVTDRIEEFAAEPVVLSVVPELVEPELAPVKPVVAVVEPVAITPQAPAVKVRNKPRKAPQPTRSSRPRDYDGAMDEWDIAELTGMPRKQVKRLITELEGKDPFGM